MLGRIRMFVAIAVFVSAAGFVLPSDASAHGASGHQQNLVDTEESGAATAACCVQEQPAPDHDDCHHGEQVSCQHGLFAISPGRPFVSPAIRAGFLLLNVGVLRSIAVGVTLPPPR